MNIVLFHSALGLRPAVTRFADRLRAAGHVVTTPDLFEGKVFDRLEDGVAQRDAIGIEGLAARAEAAVAGLGDDLVFAGFSMGAACAQMLALSRPKARGLVLMHGALPLEMFGVGRWPETLRAQIHYAEGDRWMDLAVPATLAGPLVEVHRYPGTGHLFADEEDADFHAESAATMERRVHAFIARC